MLAGAGTKKNAAVNPNEVAGAAFQALGTRDPLKMADRLGLDVESIPQWGSRHLDVFVPPVIGIPKGVSRAERRVRVAHCLGHFYMHAGNQLWLIGFERTWTRKMEREAEAFAAHLLIPATLDQNGWTNVWDVAEDCDVTEDLVRLLAWPEGADPCRGGGSMTEVLFDKQEQLDQITPWLLDDERLYCVFDCKGAGTGFVAVTDKRLMFYDRAFMRKRKALTSIPFSRITSVSSIDEGGIFRSTSELVVKAGSEEHEFEFRGGDKAQRAYQFIMAELVS